MNIRLSAAVQSGMKRKHLFSLLGALALSFLGTSCSDYGYAPATKRGAVAGGLVGAGVGTIIGSQSDRPLEGAAIGGAIGALGGAALGSARDDEYQRGRSYNNRPYYGSPNHYRGGYYESSSYYPRPYYGHGYSRSHHYHGGGRYYGGGGCRY